MNHIYDSFIKIFRKDPEIDPHEEIHEDVYLNYLHKQGHEIEELIIALEIAVASYTITKRLVDIGVAKQHELLRSKTAWDTARIKLIHYITAKGK